MSRSDASRHVLTESGAYLLYLELGRSICLEAGALGKVRFPAGRYIYVGSARNGIKARVARHARLAKSKSGRPHWHVDYLLLHPQARLKCVKAIPGAQECVWSRRIACRKGSSVPVRGFGSSDCRVGCLAHLYRIA